MPFLDPVSFKMRLRDATDYKLEEISQLRQMHLKWNGNVAQYQSLKEILLAHYLFEEMFIIWSQKWSVVNNFQDIIFGHRLLTFVQKIVFLRSGVQDGKWLEHSGRAHACGAKLLRSWVQIPLGTVVFLLLPFSGASLIQIPHGGATLLTFLF